MQKKRPRRTGRQTATAGGAVQPPGASASAPVGKGRPTHVRNRLIVAVAVVAAAVAAAGAPSVVAASGRLSDSQGLVTLAGQTEDALALAHSLADERDEVTSYVAAGRPKSQAPSEQRSTRVDRQTEELRTADAAPGWLRADLDGIAAVRHAALTGQSSALQAHQAYSAVIADLHRLAEQLAQRMTSRAGGGAYSLAELDTAVQQAAAARGLLLAALHVPHSARSGVDPVTGLPAHSSSSSADSRQRDALSAAAQQARVRSDAALAEFRDTAPETARASYDSTVTGPEVDSADGYLKKLTAAASLSDSDLAVSSAKVDAALSARVDLMRGAESSLYDHRTKDLAALRDDDVTGLEIRVALLGALLLVSLGVATAMARTLTRPLSALRRGSARLAAAEDASAEAPIAFTGRDDEFAQVVRSVNTLHAQALALAQRVATLEADRKHLVGQRQKTADAREELRAELDAAAVQLQRLHGSIGATFVNLALRTLGLVERQLGVIEGLEEHEQDPERLATLFKLDHFATVMRRHSENLLVLAGAERVQQHAGPVPLVDVVRAAVSEIERYERVRIAVLPPHAHVAGFAADDLSHLLAELLENATSFSPPDQPVEVSGWLLENGEIMLSVQDEGIGIAEDRMTRLNARLAEFDPETPYDQETDDGLGLGLYVAGRLAHRHGARVRLREQKQGGAAAVVVVPRPLLAAAPAAAVPAPRPAHSAAAGYSLPGAYAEANSNVLPGRPTDGPADPLLTLAEQAVRQSETPRPPSAPYAAPGAAPAPTPAREPAGEPFAAPEPYAAPGAVPEPGPASAPFPAPGSTAEPFAAPGASPAPASGPANAPFPAPRSEGVPFAAPGPTAEPCAAPGPAPASAAAPASESFAAPGSESDPFAAPGPPAEPFPVPGPLSDPFARSAPAPAAAPLPAAASLPGAAPPESPVETTMELLLPSPAAEGFRAPPREAAAPDPAPHAPLPHAPAPPGPADAVHERVVGADEDPVTARGLPKRTPKSTTPTHAPRQRTGSVDADALRRRLGGFRRGAQAGYREVEAEIAERTAQHQRPAPAGHPHVEDATGGTVEEASS
ncbi:nitrate- and nitrite sensing domain-containing protein [Streptomyces sp. NPDC046985]|uniref:sensor histidine kinase n=1 Tax=Streptomyces sp. NPDC046985 TaxID=3155377 RepID=UPI0033C75EB3